ncbi:MAG: Uncharacterized protein FD139_3124 [Methylocystaceae bacterium]|nr:MAG: Uncharacterized protein FD148_1260 [Methylocystaceae bacterium]KAF0209759.1 MAG: hypothetical protein FD172_3163 [Methylocystaceae bacterium]TXT43122.1 MAG: Uncharacterized protein FD139_3124 [Methylocystaceae bacterium]
MAEQKKRIKKQSKRAQEIDHADRLRLLLEETQAFCRAVGLHENLIVEIAKADNDWAFILKIEALIETGAREIVRHGLKIKLLNRVISNDALHDFVDTLPMNGRTSILKLLDASGLPPEELGFVEAILRVRNAYAHNIRFADVSLIDLVKQRPDKAHLLKHLSAIKNYDEAKLIQMYEKDGGFLRFGILDSAMRFLFFAYHLAAKHRPPIAAAPH